MERIELTSEEAESRCEIGKLENMNVRFFIYGLVNEEIDIVEVEEREFLETSGNVEYERHTVFANGVKQICLTKNNLEEC